MSQLPHLGHEDSEVLIVAHTLRNPPVVPVPLMPQDHFLARRQSRAANFLQKLIEHLVSAPLLQLVHRVHFVAKAFAEVADQHAVSCLGELAEGCIDESLPVGLNGDSGLGLVALLGLFHPVGLQLLAVLRGALHPRL